MKPPLGTYSPETRHLNTKFTMREVDTIVRMGRAQQTALDICTALDMAGTVCSPNEVIRIGEEAGVFIRLARRVS